MKQELGEGLEVEQGAALTELQGAPDFDASPKGPPAEPRPAQAPADKPNSRSDKRSKPVQKRDHTGPIAKPAPKRVKSNDQPPEKSARKQKSNDKRPQDAAPKKQIDSTEPKAKPSAKAGKQRSRDKKALNRCAPGKPGTRQRPGPKMRGPHDAHMAKAGNPGPSVNLQRRPEQSQNAGAAPLIPGFTSAAASRRQKAVRRLIRPVRLLRGRSEVQVCRICNRPSFSPGQACEP